MNNELLSTKLRKNTGMSNHEHACRLGWTFDFDLTPDEYVLACECFKSVSELRGVVRKSVKRSIMFRMSLLGRLVSFIVNQMNKF